MESSIVSKKLFGFKKSHFLFFLIAISGCLKLLYVFCVADYRNYLWGDMDYYFQTALLRLAGRDYELLNYMLYAPFFHCVLAALFKGLSILQLDRLRLEAVLGLNIFLSTLSVPFLFSIAESITKNSYAALCAAFLYAFSFPVFYYNSVMLSVNLGLPMLILAIFFLFRGDRSQRSLFVSGLLLGVGVAARPMFGLIAVPFAIYAFLRPYKFLPSLIRTCVFAAGFMIVIGGVTAENFRISGGRLLGLSSGGGCNFCLAQCKPSKIVSPAPDISYWIDPPTYSKQIARGTYEASRPFYEQGYFYALGLGCIKDNPRIWLENIVRFKHLFFGPLFPVLKVPPLFQGWMPLWRNLLLGMSLSLFLSFIPFLSPFIDRAKFGLLLATIFSLWLVLYFFSDAEQRYLYYFEFMIYLTAATVGFVILRAPFFRKSG